MGDPAPWPIFRMLNKQQPDHFWSDNNRGFDLYEEDAIRVLSVRHQLSVGSTTAIEPDVQAKIRNIHGSLKKAGVSSPRCHADRAGWAASGCLAWALARLFAYQRSPSV